MFEPLDGDCIRRNADLEELLVKKKKNERKKINVLLKAVRNYVELNGQN